MGARGPARAPNLQVVKEGNPQNRSAAERDKGLKLPPGAPPEPDWLELFPVVKLPTLGRKPAKMTDGQLAARERLTVARAWQQGEQKRARDLASSTWRRVVRVLDAQGLLADIDAFVLTDCCVCWARIVQCERDVSANGLRQLGERGWVRNGSITSATSYRQQFRYYVGQLGLSPVARDLFTPDPGADDGEDSDLDF